MAIELITGHADAAHVSSADARAFNANAFTGASCCFLASEPAITMADANTLTIGACEMLAQGAHVRITGTESLTIQSGTQSYTRIDVVNLHYEQDEDTGVETVELQVVTGTPAASNPETPTTEYTGLSILDGERIVDIPIATVTVAGLTPTPALTAYKTDQMAFNTYSSGIWRVRHGHNGTVEAWAIQTYNGPVNTSGGGGYYHVCPTIDFPVTFTATPNIQLALESGQVGAQTHINTASATQVSAIIFRPTSDTSTRYHALHWRVIGTAAI